MLLDIIGSLILSIVATGFFLGGAYSPLWVFKWYRKFYSMIGMNHIDNNR